MEKIFFVGGYAPNGLSVCKIQEGSRSIELSHRYPAENPSYLALAPKGDTLYCVHECETFFGEKGGGVSAYRLEEDGALKYLNSMGTLGELPCHLSVTENGKALLVANYNGGNICLFAINQDSGEIGPLLQNIQHQGNSINAERQEKPHPHFIAQVPGTPWICVCDLGIDKIVAYHFSNDYSSVTEKREFTVTPGNGPRHIAFHPCKNILYLVNELSVTVCAIGYNTETMEMEQLAEYPLLNHITQADSSAAIHLTGNGEFLGATVRGANCLSLFKVLPDGKLEPVQNFLTGGEGPRDFTWNENVVLYSNQLSNLITAYPFNQQTGKAVLGREEKIKLEAPVCVLWKEKK